MKNYLVQYLSRGERRFMFVLAHDANSAWLIVIGQEAKPLKSCKLMLEKTYEGHRVHLAQTN